jgi:hypothetical protein
LERCPDESVYFDRDKTFNMRRGEASSIESGKRRVENFLSLFLRSGEVET